MPRVKRGNHRLQRRKKILDRVLAGEEVKVAFTPVAGCLVGRSKTPAANLEGTAINYTKHVAPILQKHCQVCHRAGEVGPFKLMNYKDAAAWADNIKEVVTEGRMPPWHADPKVGHFSNDRRLTEDEKKTLLTWIDQGCNKGNPADEPAPRQYITGWSIGKPDVVLQMTKTTAALQELNRAKLPYVSILTDPTMGGVSASFAFVGDVVIAEPKALIGFAGPRVIENTVRVTLPEGFQRAEFLQTKGAVDFICDRRELRKFGVAMIVGGTSYARRRLRLRTPDDH